MTKRIKYGTLDTLSLSWKKFESHEEQIPDKLKQLQGLNRPVIYSSFGDKQIRHVSGGTCLKCLSPLRKSSASLGMSVGDLWRVIVSRKSQVSELKNWMPKHSKKTPSVRVELRAGGDPHRSEKPRWSAGDMRQRPKKEKGKRNPVSPTGVLFLVF